ncbi:alpha/beta hydrolase [Pseudomonas sp. RW407]|uniref:major capsid protein n=1 Tax=Pseudomonas sp. RW407 TaxID=2202894 RepID=UPI000D6F797B|nr:major capsid protein [Pseudomonas sp. RW407]PWU29117.1 alpha/beta hydrolase [Pseudomonas sp. RW407]
MYQSKKEVLKAGLKSLPARIGVAAASAVMAAGAFADDAIDVTPVTGKLSAGEVAVGTVCAAGLGIYILVRIYRYLRSAA